MKKLILKKLILLIFLSTTIIGQAQITKTIRFDSNNNGLIKVVYSDSNKKTPTNTLTTTFEDSIIRKNMKVSQDTVSKTVNIIAGSLSNVLNDTELASITNLTITGTIDARDFVTMWGMPVLAVLNIGSVNITSYTGIVISSWSETYPANTIPFMSFRSGSLKSITLPNSLISIEESAFSWCSGLTRINIPSSVSSINDGAFFWCIGMTEITVDEKNSNYTATNGVLFNKNQSKLIWYPSGREGAYSIPNTVVSIANEAFSYSWLLTSITIPNSVTAIGENAFRNCESLTSITLPNSVTAIGNYAFSSCKGLTSVVIPSTLTSIGLYAFADCKLLTEFYVDGAHPNYSAINGVLFNKSQTTLIQYPGGRKGVYTMPNTVTEIGIGAFFRCSGLTSVIIPNSLETIESCAFQYCSGLTNITIPNAVTSIGIYAFNGCNSLTSITIPSFVKYIGYYAFESCTALTSIKVYASNPIDLISSPGVFHLVDMNTCTLFVPMGSLSAYRFSNQWGDFKNIIEMKGLVLSPMANIAPIEGSSATVNVTSNTTWTISSDQTWFSVSPASGSNNAILTFTANANLTSSPRTAIVKITPVDADVQTIIVIQDAIILEVSNAITNLAAIDGSEASVNITSNIIWTANSDQTWLKVNKTSGNSNTTLTLMAAANLDTAPRMAIVTISGTGVASKTITVTQATLYTLTVNIAKKWSDVVICDNSTNQFIGYQWYNNDKAIKDAVQQFYYQPNGLSGRYYVEAFNANGERGFSNLIDISSIQQSKSLNIYPNPANIDEKITVEMKLSQKELNGSSITIYSVNGETIRKMNNLQDRMTLQFNKQGTYILQLLSKEGIVKEATKFIVTR